MKKKSVKVKKVKKVKGLNNNENNIKISIKLDKDNSKKNAASKSKNKKVFSYAPQFGGQARVISTSQPYTPLEELKRVEYAKNYNNPIKAIEDTKQNNTLNQLFLTTYNDAKQEGIILKEKSDGNIIIEEIDDELTAKQEMNNKEVLENLSPIKLKRVKEQIDNIKMDKYEKMEKARSFLPLYKSADENYKTKLKQKVFDALKENTEKNMKK